MAEDQYADAYGHAYRITLVDNLSEPIDLRTATDVYIHFFPPKSTTPIVKTAALLTDGRDGVVQYVTEDGDFKDDNDSPIVGVWKVRVVAELPGPPAKNIVTETEFFEVAP